MFNLIKGEFYKLTKSKAFICMIILAVLCGVLAINKWNVVSGVYPKEMQNASFVIIVGKFMFLRYSFLFSIFAYIFIVKEFKGNSILKSISYGCKLWQVIVSKILIYLLASLLMLCIYIGMLLIYTSIKSGFGEIKIFYVVISIFIDIMGMLASISVFACIAVITRKTIITILSPLLMWLPFFFDNTDRLKVFAYMPFQFCFITAKAEQISTAPLFLLYLIAFFSIVIVISVLVSKKRGA